MRETREFSKKGEFTGAQLHALIESNDLWDFSVELATFSDEQWFATLSKGEVE